LEKLVYNIKEKSWKIQHVNKIEDINLIEKFNPLLDLFKVADFFYWSDVDSSTPCSEGVRSVLGIEPDAFSPDLIYESIHPDDIDDIREFSHEAEEFLASLSEADQPYCKVQYIFRIKTATGKTKPVMLQKIHDLRRTEKNAGYLFILTDLSFLHMDNETSLSLVHYRDGHSIISISKSGGAKNLPGLTSRQWEVLRIVTSTCDLPKAADQLEINLVTLRNHLKKIRKKLDAKSMVHILALAEEKKWFTKRNEQRRNSQTGEETIYKRIEKSGGTGL
jgi:DNA-binding CsgD family transcriptional regulator